jgi:hypothetical protein
MARQGSEKALPTLHTWYTERYDINGQTLYKEHSFFSFENVDFSNNFIEWKIACHNLA